MSTAGKFGERQSWRRAGNGEQKKRRTTKIVLTAIATLLLLLFLYILFSRDRETKVRTILIAPPYNADIVTAPLFADSARARFEEQLGAAVIRDDSETVLSSFRDTDVVTRYLDDKDDTVLVVLRGFLLRNSEGVASLACSDLGIDEKGQPTGLVPLSELLEPLANQAPSSFNGLRLVVLDLEPLAGHPTLGQWNDDALTSLDEVVRELQGVCADRVFLLATRGPLQNVGWNSNTSLPYSTEILLDALGGLADLNQDRDILLDELCAYISSRYARLPRNADTEMPQLMLLRGGEGWVDKSAIDAGSLQYRVAWTDPIEEEPESSDQEEEESDDEAEVDSATGDDKVELADAEEPNQPTESGAVNEPTEDASAEAGNATTILDAPNSFAKADVWELKDRFEDPDAFSDSASISPIALAPHLWRQLFVKVLSNEVRGYDPNWSTDVPNLVADDLRKLWKLSRGETQRVTMSDEFTTKLAALVDQARNDRRRIRVDRRIQSLDQLQHTLTVARHRSWALLEYQRHAVTSNIQAPRGRLDASLKSSESLLVSARGTQDPLQADVDRLLAELRTNVSLFDKAVSDHVDRLLGDSGFALRDPARTWELNRQAWTLLRSPLPSSDQRRQLVLATETAPNDDDDTAEREIQLSEASFAPTSVPAQGAQLSAQYRSGLQRYMSSDLTGESSGWPELLESSSEASFADRFAVSLRVDPRLDLANTNLSPLLHAADPVPVVRRPSVTLLDESLSPVASPVSIALDTLQDTQRIVVRVRPDRPKTTNLLVSCELQSQSFGSPIVARWRIPGLPQVGLGETIRVVVNADEPRDLPLEIAALEAASPGERPAVVIRIRGESEEDQVDGVVGTYPVSVELPQPNRLRLVASAHRRIGCSKESVSGEDDLTGGLWLRTFHRRKTPFQLRVYNESDLACRARVWLVRLPNAMPKNVSAYWPDVAANRYSKPEGGLLDGSGRIQEQFMRDERVLMGPAIVSLPAGRERVPLDFTPAPPAEGEPEPEPPKPIQAIDVSHGMALVARLVDDEGNATSEPDQVIVMAAKPWAPRNYIELNSEFIDGEIEVVAELKSNIDGDDLTDEVPEIEKEPLIVLWTEDENWSGFQGESTTPPDQREMKLRMQAGGTVNDFRVPVSLGRRESWVNIDVDGWPRAIRQRVDHQQNARGVERTKSEVGFSSISLLLDPEKTEKEPLTYYAPETEVYFQGRGEAIRTILKADFASNIFNRKEKPEIRLTVERRTYIYQTDRSIQTTLVSLSPTGVVELLTTVGDLVQDLNQGQQANDRIPLLASLNVGSNERDAAALTAVLDSTPPGSIAINAERVRNLTAPMNLRFSVSAQDSARDASGIRKIEFGLDSKGDGKIDSQRREHIFDPPRASAEVPLSKCLFKFQEAIEYAVVARAIDACGNERTDEYRFTVNRKPKPAPVKNDDPKNTKPAIVYGRLHGSIDSSVGMSGTLFLSPAPKSVTRKDKDILGQDKSFNFGMLPAGQYTLTFKGAMNNRTVTLKWSGLEVDTTARQTKPVRLDPKDAE